MDSPFTGEDPARDAAERSGGYGQPVRLLRGESPDDRPPEPMGLCLSGGGYRAMLYHAGALWRLNEAGFLPELTRVSSVSGGSVTAAVLALAWPGLGLDRHPVSPRFEEEVVGPLRRLAGRTIDVPAVLRGLLPGTTASREIARSYRKLVFKGPGADRLDALPASPRFVINATNLQSGVLWRFTRDYCWDYRVGKVEDPPVSLATAVAASSAFPPFLSPAELRFADSDYREGTGVDLQRPPYTTHVVLSDGGVYDNLALETVWKRCRTVLVSDGGGALGPRPRPGRDWARGSLRVLGVIDNQVRSLRKRQTIAGFEAGTRDGAYWGIRSDIERYPAEAKLPCPHRATLALAAVPTRLARLDRTTQERLVNWGYAVCDAALRSHLDIALSPPAGFPYPRAGVGAG